MFKDDLHTLVASHETHLSLIGDSLDSATPRKSILQDRSAQKSSSGVKPQSTAELSEVMLKKRTPPKHNDNLACDEDLSEILQKTAQGEDPEYRLQVVDTTKLNSTDVQSKEEQRYKLATPKKDPDHIIPELTEFQLRKFLLLRGFLGQLRHITDSLGGKAQEFSAKIS